MSVHVACLTKRFRSREGLPAGSAFGNVHWMISMLLRSRSPVRDFTAVNGVDLNVERGELFGLLGPNGAGKTTLIKCLATLLTPDGGTARINGFDLHEDTEQVKLSVNLIGSGHWIGFDWGLTVRQNLEFFGYLYGMDRTTVRARIDEAVASVGLDGKLRDMPGDLSSGERQKMLLAKGFLVRTPIFFLDEPTVGLDPVSARDVRSYIQGTLSRELGLTILLTTHYMQEAEALCERVAIMNHGRIIACDTPEMLKQHLREQGVLELTTSILPPAVQEALCMLPAVQGVVAEPDWGHSNGICQLRLLSNEPDQTAAAAVDMLRDAGVEVTRIGPTEVTLEDVFLALTGRGLAT